MKTAIPRPSKQSIIREAKDYVMIAIGMILYGIGWTVFLLPNDITTGEYRVLLLSYIGLPASRAIYVFYYQLLPAVTGSQTPRFEILHQNYFWSIHPDLFLICHTEIGSRYQPSSRPAFYGMRYRSILLWRWYRGGLFG